MNDYPLKLIAAQTEEILVLNAKLVSARNMNKGLEGQIAALKAEIIEIEGKLHGERIRNHDIGEQIDTLTADNSRQAEEIERLNSELTYLRIIDKQTRIQTIKNTPLGGQQ